MVSSVSEVLCQSPLPHSCGTGGRGSRCLQGWKVTCGKDLVSATWERSGICDGEAAAAWASLPSSVSCLEWGGQAALVGESWGHVPNSSGTDGYTAGPKESHLTARVTQGQTWLSHTKPPPAVFVLEEVSNPNNQPGPRPETRAYLGTANDEPPAGLQVVNGVLIQVLGRHHGLDHLLLQGLAHFLQCHVLVVLHGDDDGVDPHGDDSAIVLRVLHCHLSEAGETL